MKLYDYQIKNAKNGYEILNKYKIVCLFMEVRTGKTLTSLEICRLSSFKSVLFLTKKKAIPSVIDDYNNFNYSDSFNIEIINRESLHKIDHNNFDCVIVDEVHGYSSFPKPSKYFKDVNYRFGYKKFIFLSGTPTPESYSQYYHIFQLSNYSPFRYYSNFYKWANDFVIIELKNYGYKIAKDYSNAIIEEINPYIEHLIITETQKNVGFKTSVNENILEVEMKPTTYKMIDILKKDKVLFSKKTGREIIADTGAKLQQKIHQLFSGTIKLDNGKRIITDDSKAVFIKKHFKNKKIAIFYNFVAELELLKNTFGDDLTTDLEEFNNSNKNMALQIVSGREGISLKNADCLVMFNIQFSAVSYWQSRDRLTTKERTNNNVYWIFSKKGIEHQIYKTVLKKKNYTLSVFKRDFL